jgi:hypothetical protein
MFQHVKYLLVSFIQFGNVCKSVAQSGKHALPSILQDEHKLPAYKKQYQSGNKVMRYDVGPHTISPLQKVFNQYPQYKTSKVW